MFLSVMMCLHWKNDMRRVKDSKVSKRALTLVELVVAMALTMIFAAACIALIYPISRLYMHINQQARVQVIADNVVDALRAECSRTYMSSPDDVWISDSPSVAYTLSSVPLPSARGPVLMMRRNYNHCETIASCYSLSNDDFDAYSVVLDEERASLEDNGQPQTGANGSTASRAIYRMFDPAGDPEHRDANEGYVHFGYFESDPNASGLILPIKYYDFTNPLSFAAYGDYGVYTVSLMFHDIQCTTEANGNAPAYVLCDVSVMQGDTAVYTRSDVVLCFASPVV